jgi:hypothetical protein
VSRSPSEYRGATERDTRQALQRNYTHLVCRLQEKSSLLALTLTGRAVINRLKHPLLDD